MNKIITSLCCLFISIIILTSCNAAKDTPESIAQKWCDLNGKVYKAADGADKEKAKEERKKYENIIEEKYGKDADMKEKVKKAVEACEDASEGRK